MKTLCQDHLTFCLVTAGILLVSTPVLASPIQFDFVSEPASTGACIEFKGATQAVTFPDASDARDFIITQSDTAALVGIRGTIDGTFTVGAITTTTVGLLQMQTALLTGIGGTFSLWDPGGQVLSATLVWNDIYTYGATGGLNPEDALNLTGWTYSGTFAPFVAIKNDPNPSGTDLSFQFSPAKNLSQLMASGADMTTTYSGSFAVAPEPATLSLLALGGLGLLRRRRKG